MVKPVASAPAQPAAVTGVASGGLGTAANLEDTQLWDLEDLRAPDHEPYPEPVIADEAPPARVAAAVHAAEAAPLLPTRVPLAATERPIVAPAQPVSAPVVRAQHGQRRTGPIAAAALGIVVLAAVLALREGLPGGATRGSGDAAGAFPSLPAVATPAPKATAEPKAESGGGGGKNGHGNGGNGNGNGHGGKDH